MLLVALRHRAAGFGVRLLAPVVLVLAALLGGAASAPAHGDDESAEEYVLVQQAIGYLLNLPGDEAAMHAQEKIVDALASPDQDGVSVSQVRQARDELAAGRAEEARELLQNSIADAVKSLAPATGIGTGTGTVLAPLPAQPTGTLGWALLALSAIAASAGVWLALLFRPRENVGELRREMGLAARHKDTPGNSAEGGRR
jgi:hypothetical protein